MAVTPLLTGDFIKIIDNSSRVRIPRTIAEAVQLPDGSSLQDYINGLNLRLDDDLSLDTILEIFTKLEELEADKLETESESDLVLEVTEDNTIKLRIGEDVVKTLVFADTVNNYMDNLSSDKLITENKVIVEAINELDLRIDETVIYEDEVDYEKETLEQRIIKLEEAVKKLSVEENEDNADELAELEELLFQQVEESDHEGRIVRLERIIELVTLLKL